MEIKNKHILITGANRGIGKALAQRFAEDGAHLHLVSRSALNETEFPGASSICFYQADFRENLSPLVEKLKEVDLDIVIHNAGFFHGDLLEKQSMESVHQMVDVNLYSVMHLTQSLLPKFMARGSGKFVFNSSILGVLPLPGSSTYNATKAGVISFAQTLRGELKGSGVSTLLLLTPAVKTELFQQVEGASFGYFGLGSLGVTVRPLPASKFAEMVREAILLDTEVLRPLGILGVTERLAQYLPRIFDFTLDKLFSRPPQKGNK